MFFKRSFVATATVLAILAFLPGYLLVPVPHFDEMLNGAAVTVGVAVAAVYGRGVVQGFRQNRLTPGHLLALGITLSWTAVVIRLVWTWVDRMSGSWTDGLPQFAVWLFIVGGLFYLTSTNAIDGQIPTRNWVILAVLWSIGVSIGAFIALYVIAR